MSCTRMTTLAFLILEIFFCFAFKIDFLSALSLKYSSKYFDSILLKCRTGQDGVSCTRMTTLLFLFLALSPFVIFDSNYALVSCPFCKSIL